MAAISVLSQTSELILPSDAAETIASTCFLHIVRSKYSLIRIPNATACAQDHSLPLVCFNGKLISGFSNLCNALQATKPKPKGDQTSADSVASRCLRQTQFNWISDVLRNIVLYFSWMHDPSHKSFILPRIGRGLPSFMGGYMAGQERRRYRRYLSCIDWDKKTMSEVVGELEGICLTLTQILDKGPYFYERETPGRLDALVYGYWTMFEQFKDMFAPLNKTLQQSHAILEFVKRIDTLLM